MKHKKDFASKSFEDKANLILTAFPKEPVVKYIIEHKNYNWYNTLDRISPNFGLSFGQSIVFNNKYKVVGYKPYIRLDSKKEDLLSSETYFTSESDSKEYLAKEVIYAMMRVWGVNGINN